MIIVLFILFYILLLCYSYQIDSFRGLLIAFVIIITIQQLLLLRRQNFIHHFGHPRYGYKDIYDLVQHGDILFSACNERTTGLDRMLSMSNYSISHAAIIVVEDGMKYIVHGYYGRTGLTQPIDEKPVIKGLDRPFRLYKEPFLMSLLVDKTSIYQILRHPTFQLPMNDDLKLPEDKWLNFCTSAISVYLKKHKLIRNESEKLIAYQPDSLINQLLDKGYESTFIYHDKLLDV